MTKVCCLEVSTVDLVVASCPVLLFPWGDASLSDAHQIGKWNMSDRENLS